MSETVPPFQPPEATRDGSAASTTEPQPPEVTPDTVDDSRINLIRPGAFPRPGMDVGPDLVIDSVHDRIDAAANKVRFGGGLIKRLGRGALALAPGAVVGTVDVRRMRSAPARPEALTASADEVKDQREADYNQFLANLARKQKAEADAVSAAQEARNAAQLEAAEQKRQDREKRENDRIENQKRQEEAALRDQQRTEAQVRRSEADAERSRAQADAARAAKEASDLQAELAREQLRRLRAESPAEAPSSAAPEPDTESNADMPETEALDGELLAMPATTVTEATSKAVDDDDFPEAEIVSNEEPKETKIEEATAPTHRRTQSTQSEQSNIQASHPEAFTGKWLAQVDNAYERAAARMERELHGESATDRLRSLSRLRNTVIQNWLDNTPGLAELSDADKQALIPKIRGAMLDLHNPSQEDEE